MVKLEKNLEPVKKGHRALVDYKERPVAREKEGKAVNKEKQKNSSKTVSASSSASTSPISNPDDLENYQCETAGSKGR